VSRRRHRESATWQVETCSFFVQPRLRQCFDPAVQVKTSGGNRAFGVNRATAILHAVTDALWRFIRVYEVDSSRLAYSRVPHVN
jgi:hypothetical protein